MVTQFGPFILVYVECKVAIPMVSTRKTDDDHHVADSEAIGRLRHELIKSTGNPRISSGVKLSNSTSSKSVSTKYSLKKRHFVNTLSDAVGGSQRSSMHDEITLTSVFWCKIFHTFRVWGLNMLMFVKSTTALGQLTSPTGDFPKQTSLCIAALATVSDGELLLRFMSRLGQTKK